MATARKLPSGSYRVKVFKGYKYINGQKKREYESFTASTKAEAEALAAAWKLERNERPEDVTVHDAILKYIDVKEPVLSPSTIRSYNAMKSRFAPLDALKLRELNNMNVQTWISSMSRTLKYKSVKNTYGLLTAALSLYGVDKQFNVQLPTKIKKEYRLPTDQEMKKILSACEGTELWIAVMLARYYSLRRSEICALDSDDLKRNVLTIRKAMIFTKDCEWIIKPFPKTADSYRKLAIADPLLAVLKAKTGRYVELNPNNLTSRFTALLKQIGLPHYNFHLLRHSFASNAALLGVPDFYTAKIGGWSQNSSVLKEVYQNVNQQELFRQMDILNNSMHHDLRHEQFSNSPIPHKYRKNCYAGGGTRTLEDEADDEDMP